MNVKKLLTLATGLVLALALMSCSRNDIDEPSPLGPSTLATVLKVTANPNVMDAGENRRSSMIVVSLKKFDGTPLAGRAVFLEVNDATDRRAHIGYFTGDDIVATRVTDGGGNAYIKYYAPIKDELRASCIVHIWASLPGNERTFLQEYAEIYIVR